MGIEPARPRVAYLFPGQGSQAVGMGRDLFERSAAARDVFRRADDAFGDALSDLCFNGPDDALRPTHIQQPALVATSLAAFAAYGEALGLPAWPVEAGAHPVDVVVAAGHSVGLWSAVAAAGAVEVEDAIRLVADRGRYMSAAGSHRPGSMAAVLGLDPAAVESLVGEVRDRTLGSYLSVANVNAPAQVVVGGDLGSIEALREAAVRAGARRVVPLPVTAAFHTAAMLPAWDAMRERLLAAELREPAVPILSNLDGTPMTTVGDLRAELADHIAAPVRWLDAMQRLASMGVSHAVEYGHGAVLTGMLRRTVVGMVTYNVSEVADARRVAHELGHG